MSGSRRTRATRANNPLAVLAQATGALCFFHGGYGAVRDGSNLVSSLTSRVGGWVLTSSGAAQPTWGATSSTGRPGFTFAGAQRLFNTDGVLAGILDGTQAYSALVVASNTGAAAQRAAWALGNSSVGEFVYSGVEATGKTANVRRTVALGSTVKSDTGTAGSGISLRTEVFTGSALSTWLNSTADQAAVALTHAPVCDTFLIGSSRNAGSYERAWSGVIWCVLIALGQWSTTERQLYESIARTYWGTP